MKTDSQQQDASTAIPGHPMSEYSILYHDTDKGQINVGVVIVDGVKLSIRFSETNVAVRRFCELVGTKMPASFDRAKEKLRRHIELAVVSGQKKGVLAIVAQMEAGPIRLTDPMWVSSNMSIDDLFADCVVEIKADGAYPLLERALSRFVVVTDAQSTEALCERGGHAPMGGGQCGCGWRGEEDR
jgi:hypothetical protein